MEGNQLSLQLEFSKIDGIAYISGPMSGFPELNYPAFFEAEKFLEQRFTKVLNPAKLELDKDQEPSWENWMRKALCMMLAEATHIVLLPGWEISKGAKFELQTAEVLGLKIIEYDYINK